MNVAHFSIRYEIVVDSLEGKIQFQYVNLIVFVPVHIVVHPAIVGQLFLVNDAVLGEVVEGVDPLEFIQRALECLDIITLGAETDASKGVVEDG